MQLSALLEEGLRNDRAETVRGAHIVEALNGKVSTFLTVFTSILTQYDKQIYANEVKRGGGGNIYRLSLWFAALDRARANVQGAMNDDSKEAVAKLKDAISKEFTKGNPGDKMIRVLDAYLTKGTLPKIPISKEVKAAMAAERQAAKAAKAAGKKPSDVALAAESLLDSKDVVLVEGKLSDWEFELPSGATKLKVDKNGRFTGTVSGRVDAPPDDAGKSKSGTFTGSVSGAFYKSDWDTLVKSLSVDLDDVTITAVGLPTWIYTADPKGPLKIDHNEAEVAITAKGGKDLTPKLFLGAPPSLLFDAQVTGIKMSKMEGLEEAQPGMAVADEEETKPGAFKISSKALAILKQMGEVPEGALFKAQRKVIDDLSSDDLNTLFGADSQDKAQDFIAGSPKKAFLKWLSMATRVSPKLGKLIRAQPENAALLFYVTVARISGRDMADIVLKRYFETESDHVGAVKARMKVEELEEAIIEAKLDSEYDIADAIEEFENIVKTMRSRLSRAQTGKGDDAWLKQSIGEELSRMEQQTRLLRRLIGS